MAVKIEIHYADGMDYKLEKIQKGDWIDLCASENVELEYMDFKYIPLGIYMKLPVGYEALLVPRSSLYKKFGIIQPNSPGVIDESYCGPDDMWRLPALCLDPKEKYIANGIEHAFTMINKGDRLCQFRIITHMPEIEFVEVKAMKATESRGGFGSTGI